MNIKSEKEIYGEELERVSVADKFKGFINKLKKIFNI